MNLRGVEDLVQGNLDLVERVSRYQAKRMQLDHDDVYQEGSLGLLEAARKWDSSLNEGEFQHYAYRYVWGRIMDYARTQMPVGRRAHAKGVRVAAPMSFNVPVTEDGESLEGLVPDPRNDVAEREGELYFEELVSHLPERERMVVTLRLVEGLELHEIGEVMGFSESRASQVFGRATSQLKAVAA